jgi:RNA polymerase sigma-70 factor, ECF subfamily
MGSDDPTVPDEPDERPDLSESLVLARRAKAGDPAALEALVARYYERVLAMVRKRIGGDLRGGMESGDIVQDAMFNAARHFDQFEVRSHAELVGWFARVVAQKRDRQREVSLQDLAGPSDDSQAEFQPADVGGLPDRVAELREEDERVRLAMARLDEAHRRVLELRISENLPWAEIARRLELSSPDAARMLYVRARLMLRRGMG